MRAAASRVLSIAGAIAILTSACTGSCRRTSPGKDPGPGLFGAGPGKVSLDYADFMKASGEAIVADVARHLGVAPSTWSKQGGGSPRNGGDGFDVYALANGGKIDLHFDRSHLPLSVQYRAPTGCLSKSGKGGEPIAPADANLAVLSLLRQMGLAVDNTVHVESQLHREGLIWIGVYVWQTYRGEPIARPSVFVIVDGITGRICEMRLPRWYKGLDVLGPPLAKDALLLRARAAGARFGSGQPLGTSRSESLKVVRDRLCREVKFSSQPELVLCVDVLTGQATADRW